MFSKKTARAEPPGKQRSLLTQVEWAPDDSSFVACFGEQFPKVVAPRTMKVLRHIELDTEEVEDNTPRLPYYGSSYAPTTRDSEKLKPFFVSWSPRGDFIAVARYRKISIISTADWCVARSHQVGMPTRPMAHYLERLKTDPLIEKLRPACTEKEQLSKLQQSFKRHGSTAILSIGWLPGGLQMVVGTSAGSYIYDVDRQRSIMDLYPDMLPGLCHHSVSSPDGQYVAALFVPDDNVLGELYWNLSTALKIARPVLYIWNAKTGKIFLQYRGTDLPSTDQSQLYWAPGSRRLAWVQDNKVVVFDVWTQVVKTLVKAQEQFINHIAWSPTGDYIAVHDSTTGVVIYDTTSGTKRVAYKDAMWMKFKDVGDRVFAWSHKGDAMVVGSAETLIDMWAIPNLVTR